MEDKPIFIGFNVCNNVTYDANLFKEGLQRRGHDVVESIPDAETIIYFACGVFDASSRHAIEDIKRISSQNPRANLIVSGCLPSIDPKLLRAELGAENVEYMDMPQILNHFNIGSLDDIDATFSFDQQLEFGKNASWETGIEKKLRARDSLALLDPDSTEYYERTTAGIMFSREKINPYQIMVSRGCVYRCSYCAVPKGRGRYKSVPEEVIFAKYRDAIKKGNKRVLLVGDETGNYGTDVKTTNLTKLLQELTNIDKSMEIGIRYIEPAPLIRHFAAVKKAVEEGTIYFMCVPLQSGSQRVLKRMNRRYDIAEVKEKVLELRDSGKTILATHFMAGFPGETLEDFDLTMNAAKGLNLDTTISILFSSRPDTPAAVMKNQIPLEEIARRADVLNQLRIEQKINHFKKRLEHIEEAERIAVLKQIRSTETF